MEHPYVFVDSHITNIMYETNALRGPVQSYARISAELGLRSEMFYLEAGKLGLKEFCSLPRCLQPAPLSPAHGRDHRDKKMMQQTLIKRIRGTKDDVWGNHLAYLPGNWQLF